MKQAAALPFDLACMGRLGVDLYGTQAMTPLEETTRFRRYLGGTCGNVAVGAARLGLRCALISGVGDDPSGRFLTARLDAEGVDRRAVAVVPGRRTPLVFLGMQGAEAAELDFYREAPADAALRAELAAPLMDGLGALAICGTHFVDPAAEDAQEIVGAAREAGARIVLDIDYRAGLWAAAPGGMDAAARRIMAQAARADLVVGNVEELAALTGLTEPREAAARLHGAGAGAVVVKLGAPGAMIFPSDATLASQASPAVVPGPAVPAVNPVGAGDAFLSAFLASWLRGDAPVEALGQGTHAGALVVSRHACSDAMPYADELARFRRTARADDPEVAHLHRVRGRAARPGRVLALACDHRLPFERLMAETGRGAADVSRFKALVARAAEEAAAAMGTAPALLMDARLGADVLEERSAQGWWLGRPLEVTTSRPVALEAGPGFAADIASWNPMHVAKILVWHHPDDPDDLAAAQVETLRRVEATCQEAGVEWMLELIPPVEMGHDDASLLRGVAQIYDAGLRPDYWKLPAMSAQAGWDAAADLLARRDPHCRGIIVLGLDKPLEDVAAELALAGRQEVCAGFAVGRTVFGDAAREWFAGRADDAAAVAAMRARFETLLATVVGATAQAAE